jgi:hypothetical protein
MQTALALRRVTTIAGLATVGLGASYVVACLGDDVTPAPPIADASSAGDGGVNPDVAELDANQEPTTFTRCAWDAPFESDEIVDGLDAPGASHSSPTLTSDEATMIFTRTLRDAGGGAVVLRSTRTADGGFSSIEPVTVTGLSPAANSPIDLAISPSGDRLYLAFFVNPGVPDYELFVASGSPTTGYAMPVKVPGDVNSAVYGERFPFVAPDALYFASDFVPDSGPRDFAIYTTAHDGGARSEVPGTGVVNLAGAHDVGPTLSADGLTLYFTSNRESSNFDIYAAHRVTMNGRFGGLTKLGGIASPDFEVPRFVSSDECRLYFTRDDANGTAKIRLGRRKATLN